MAYFERHFRLALEPRWTLYGGIKTEYVNVDVCSIYSCVAVLSPANIEIVDEFVKREHTLHGSVFRLARDAMVEGAFPPIVEFNHGRHIILDGTHRLHCAQEQGIGTANVIRLHSRNQPSPCSKLHSLDSLRVIDVGERTHDAIFERFDDRLFRPIRRVMSEVVSTMRDERGIEDGVQLEDR